MRNPKRRHVTRRNAQLSTGPMTDAGKARSSQNVTLYGLHGNHFSLLKEESAVDFIAFRNAQMLELKARLEKLGVTEPAREFIFINLAGLDPDSV